MNKIQKRALIVDDSRANRMVISQCVIQYGFQATDAHETSEALNYLQNFGQFDLLLVDMKMPGMNGVEFIREVRKMSKYRTTPIIMISSESSADDINSALEAGADDYLVKPFSKDSLLTKLEMLDS
ncbi:MAG: response regulator [Verrucomicrobia bacterium]|nr:response regulator [Verrucomicrobiota bacterium]